MPDYNIHSEKIEEAGRKLLNDSGNLQSLLDTVRREIGDVLADGYSTPGAKAKFEPFFNEFAGNFQKIKDSLDGIQKYLNTLPDIFDRADQDAASGLR